MKPFPREYLNEVAVKKTSYERYLEQKQKNLMRYEACIDIQMKYPLNKRRIDL
jgi:hypothetical protein